MRHTVRGGDAGGYFLVAVLRKSCCALCLQKVQAQNERDEIVKNVTLHLCQSGGSSLRR